MACPIAFIIPPVCVMKLKQEPVLSKVNIFPILITIFGIIVAIVGISVAIYNWSEGIECSHGKEMFYCKALSNTTHPTNFSLPLQ